MSFYIYKNNQQSGPFEEAKILEWLREGKLSTEDLGCRAGATEWQALKILFPQAVGAGEAAKAAPVSAAEASSPVAAAVGVQNAVGGETPVAAKKGGGKKFLVGCGSALIIGLLISAGLGFWIYRNLFPATDKNDLPDTVAKFKLGKSYPVKGNVWGTMTSYGAEYETDSSAAGAKKTGLTYFLKNFSSESDAISEAATNKCDRPTSAKTGSLKDKSGKDVGTFNYCNGSLDFRNKTRAVSIFKFVLTKSDLAEATDDEVINFVKSLPFNSDLDMSGFASAYPSVKTDDKSTVSSTNTTSTTTNSTAPGGVLSVSEFEGKYGKGVNQSMEISVRGYILSAPSVTGSTGLTFLYEKEGEYSTKVSCWFEGGADASQFTKLKGMQYITVRGTLEPDQGSDLKKCKLVSNE
jgi:hypothetical protein